MTLPQFKICGRLEGLSLLALLFIAMPVKYGMGEPLLVRIVGPIHGLLFMAYCYGAIEVGREKRWPVTTLLLAFVLSSVPAGTHFFERRYLSDQEKS